MKALLRPLSLAYGAVAAARRRLYEGGTLRRARLAAPVISVGNLSVGGSGKTPTVAALASMLEREGHRVTILSRGYRGRFRGRCLVVSDGERLFAGPREAGDEPVMLARAVPGAVVAVGRDRAEAGAIINDRFPGRVIILDDGFQHLRLERDLDLVCIDTTTLNDRPLPEGHLREFPSAIEHAQVVVDFGNGARRFPADQVWVRARRQVEGFFDLDGARVAPPARAYLVSGIARPDRFEDDVRATGTEVVGHRRFRDHHDFPSAVDLHAEARRYNAQLVTTAKNAVWFVSRMPASTIRILTLRIRVEFEEAGRLKDRVLAVPRGLAP